MPSGRVPIASRTLGLSAIAIAEPSIERIDLGLLLRNQLGDEAEAEQQEAEHLEENDQVKQRTEAEWRHPLLDAQHDRDQACKNAERSEHETGHAEKQHRLARKKQEKRNRDEIEETN